ncbi:hypothetical protein IJG22_02085 [Candidatus Saccharibacteria bacterium]|nr:hypothetical protein [Candidatus Saccharibacteria bacterium]
MGYKSLTDAGTIKKELPIDWGYFTKKIGDCYVSTIQCRASDPRERNNLHQDIQYRFTTDELKALIPPEANSSFAMVNLLRDVAYRRDKLAGRINDRLKKNLSRTKLNGGNFAAVIDLLEWRYGRALRQMCLYDALIYMLNGPRS